MHDMRDFRLAGGDTRRAASMRLEKPFWVVLERMAQDTGLALGQLISHLDEAFKAGRDDRAAPPLSSCLRIVCLRWSATQTGTVRLIKTAGRKEGVLQSLLDEIGACSQLAVPNLTPTNDQIH